MSVADSLSSLMFFAPPVTSLPVLVNQGMLFYLIHRKLKPIRVGELWEPERVKRDVASLLMHDSLYMLVLISSESFCLYSVL